MSKQALELTELHEPETGIRYLVRRQKTPAQSYGRRFMVIWYDHAAEVAAKVGPNAALVLWGLLKHLDFRMWRHLSQKELAEALNVSRPTVSRAMKKLHDAGALERRGNATLIEWRLSRSIGYRGTAAQFHADEREERTSRPQEVPQPALPLGPGRVVRGGRKPLQVVQN